MTCDHAMILMLLPACRLHAPDKEAVHIRDRVNPHPARPRKLGRHCHHILRKY